MQNAKQSAAREALKLVRNGMRIGLGTGSTAEIFVKLLAEKAKSERLHITCVPTSIAIGKLAKSLGLNVIQPDAASAVDLAVDGADAVEKKTLHLIKGMGGALTREKIVDYAAKRFVVIVDESKVVERLGGVVPVEVIPFAVSNVAKSVKALGARPELRTRGNSPFMTDNGNLILDCHFDEIKDAPALERELKLLPGVVENGIFTKNVGVVIVGNAAGTRILR